MFNLGNRAEVVELFPSAPSGPDAAILDGVSRFNKRRNGNRWETIDLWGIVGRSLGFEIRNEGANFAKRRVLVGAAALTLVASATVGAISEIKSALSPSESTHTGETYLDLEVVSGSEDTGNLVTRVNSNTFYEQDGNVLCTFSDDRTIVTVNAGSTPSDVVEYTKGIDYGGDCYVSGIEYTHELNPQGFMLTLHDVNTNSTIANNVSYPQNVTINPAS